MEDPEKLALMLVDSITGERIAVASVNMKEPFPDEYKSKELEVNPYVWIKTWSENEGILEALVKAGIVEKIDYQLVNDYGAVAELVRYKGK